MDQACCRQSLKGPSACARKIPDMVTSRWRQYGFYIPQASGNCFTGSIYIWGPLTCVVGIFQLSHLLFNTWRLLWGVKSPFGVRTVKTAEDIYQRGQKRWLLGWITLCCGINSPSSVFKAIRAPQHTRAFQDVRRKQAVFILEEGRGEEAQNTRPPASFGLR